MMGRVILGWEIIFCVAIACMELVKQLDESRWEWSLSEYGILFWSSGINGFVIWQVAKNDSANNSCVTMLSLLAGCLLFAVMTDCKSYEVFAFTWWIAGSAGGILLLQRYTVDYQMLGAPRENTVQQLVPLLLYILIQEFFFDRFYGRADCHAFGICATALSAFGMGMLEFLLHMLISFGLLAVVQALRGNINNKGNLKQPVAFLPYITVSFWVLLFCGKNGILKRISETIYTGGF